MLTEFLQELLIKGWKLWMENGRLRYRAPKHQATSSVLEQLKQYKVEILNLLEQQPSLFEVYPLSYGQKALWFLWKLEPESPAYNVAFSCRICSEVDVVAFEKTFQLLTERHPILRSNFTKLGSEPIQQVNLQQSIDFQQIDATQWTESELQERVFAAYQSPFDLEQGKVMRVKLFTYSQQQHVLLLVIHHIVGEGWSIGILLDELKVIYPNLRTDGKVVLPPPSHYHQDYVHWQKNLIESPEGERLWEYWRQQLAGELPILDLPTDRPRPSVQTYNGASFPFALNESLTQRLKQLAQSERTTLFTLLLAAFQILLYRYTGQEDILVGSPTASRHRPEFTQIVGYLVNVVVMRANFSENPSFRKFLDQVRQTVNEALIHQDYPFALIVERLQPQRSSSHSSIFQASFVLQKLYQTSDVLKLYFQQIESTIELGGLELLPYQIPQQEAQFDLSLEMSDTDNLLVGVLKYNTDLFDEETIARMVNHFQTLLKGIITEPELPVQKLSLLSADQEYQLLVEWNKTIVDYPQHKCIHQLFEEQVEKTPDAVAVVFEDQQLTYQELNQRANQLAHHLQSLGVGPEVLVGICVERSFEMVVGLLGILKAGGAYVPLDPNYPPERLNFMLSDTQVAVLLTQQQLVIELPQHHATVVCLDTDWHDITKHCEQNPITEVIFSNLAYTIFTSGSTGKPKAVQILHSAVVNFLCTMRHHIGMTADDIILGVTTFTFDIAALEIFLPVIVGACLVIARREVTVDGTQLLDLLIKSGTTVMQATPATWQLLLEAGWQNSEGLKILCGGEALSRQLANELQARSSSLWNVYGPTETTIWSLISQVDSQFGLVAIGHPIANTKVYILDRYLQLVPIGVPGELHIGGAGLARGYLNRPELTAEKFIQNPFEEAGGRLYKTGDLARYLPDGNIEYLGRIDNQVKLRGFRIELGEIEAVLNTHDQIQQAVVIVREDTPGNKRLVAYVVISDILLTGNQLRELLLSKLPEYMIPSAFVFLDKMPLTPNGKIDRKALPAPDGEITRNNEYVAPSTPSAEIIANIFTKVLGVQNVSIHDNFFELGGHSLLATQLASRLRLAFGIEIPLRTIFAFPTVAQLDKTLTQLRTSGSGLCLPPIQTIKERAELPLSWAQERLWFINQLEGSNATYNIPLAVLITGSIDIEAVQQALSEIVRRHEVLRTSFRTVNGIPVQVVHPEARMNIQVVDLQQLPDSERETHLQQLAQQEALIPFDLEIAPLIRCSLLLLSATEYVVLMTMHHIVSDGWSMGVFISELSALYSAFRTEEPSPLPPLTIQYADFAVWQRQWLRGEVLENQLNYWRSQLQDTPSLLQLPTDAPRPKVQTYKGNAQTFSLHPELTEKLKTLSRESGTTLFMTLQAAFATLLYRYSGEADILIGTPIANRHFQEIESLIGFFVNTLVLRTRFGDNPSFESLLVQVRETTLQAYEHQDVPFEQVVEALQPERSLSYSPLFQVMFVWQNAPMGKLELPDVTLTQLSTDSTIAKFDLTLSMSETEVGLVGSWEYNTDLFDSSTIERMVAHFQNLLSAIVQNPQQTVGELPLLSAAERHQLLVDWNDTAKAYPNDKCIHQLFEEQVEKTPLSVAVVFEDQQLTYQELNHRANQLAHHLQSLGVGPEVLVGICVERSLEMVVGILGILKAGGAYVPLDSSYPQERLSFMLEDAQVSVLLTQQRLVHRLPQHKAQLVCLDTDWQIISRSSQENPITEIQVTNLAYVIYTSGSTGQPKGVAMNQLPLCNLIWWHLQNMTLCHGGKTLQFAPISFDVSFQEIFSTWCSGGTLLLITEELRRDTLSLLGFLEAQTVQRLFLPFVGLQQLAEVGISSQFIPHHLREIITAGEQLQVTPAIRAWFSQLTNCNLHNHYGPSESHVVSTFILTNLVDSWPILPPIGRCINNSQIYILDKHLQPVPVGVAGELYIGGVTLGRGYLNRPELTAEKFIQNPFEEAGGRLYKTGDLARYLPDGNIEYLGRIDNQVKIRGFRIELGEIEAVLNTHDQIQQAVVIAREDIPGNKRLVTYVITSNESLSSNHLREWLLSKLPEYMIPSAFVLLDKLPLTPSGKIDRKALPAADGEITRNNEYVAPSTPSAEIIANIFTKVLGVQNVSIHDNFFELGGHSLLATQLISRLRLAFGVEIPLRTIFAAPTVAQLDQRLTQLRTSGNGLSLPPIQPIKERAELPLSWAQERLWFINQLEGSSATYNIPLAVRITGGIDIEALQQALFEIVRRHEVLRTSFLTVNGIPVQVVHPEARMNIQVVDLQQLLDSERETHLQQLAQQEALIPFDLEVAPLIRCSLLLLSATEYVLLLTMHHIVSDGWSIGVFISELSALYSTFRTGEPSPLPPLAIQYADFAVWQRQWLRGEVLETQLDYWRSQLQDTPSLLQLPTDRPRPKVQTYQGNTQTFNFHPELTEKLKTLSRESGATLFMTLQAAFATLLYRYSGEPDILIGTPIANRHFQEIESLIGFFVNTLVLRTRFGDNPSFESLLVQVRETTLQAYEHQDVPFEQVVEALQPERSLSYSPLFQVMFVWQNVPMGKLELPDVTLTQLSTDSTIAKFDLTLSMSETAAGLVGSWEYNTDLFDSSTIERMAAHFQNLLSAIVQNPQQTVGELPLLSPAERYQLLREWNDTTTPYHTDKCIHQLFEEQVEKTPNAVAVVFENQQLTYQELNHRANQLAHYLQSLGVAPEVLVGICVERSVEMVVGLLGILKAGGAYVPFDPNYPSERLSYMLTDSAVEVLLTQQSLLQSLQLHPAHMVCLDTDWHSISQYSQQNPDTGVISTNLVYVIYTSGSTGLPKGVAIEHHGVLALSKWAKTIFTTEQMSGVLAATSICFDLSVFEIFVTLSMGGKVIVAKNVLELNNLHTAGEVTLINTVPSVIAELLKTEGIPRQVKTVNLAGEALQKQVVENLYRYDNIKNVYNLYGPSEDTTYSTFALVEKGTSEQITIGRPISNTQTYILDKYLQPVPIGVPGELCIGGNGLARSYLNRPELTAEKFIQNPFEEAGGRLYKTGDLARYLPNGNIEYLGRIDNQVKIRGFRIELGEIEAVLNTHDQIQQTVVITREDIPGNKRLVAYVITSNESLSSNHLRELLLSKLPEYMIPSAFVFLDKLPLTPSGKIDRKALPAPDGAIIRNNEYNEYVAPSTPSAEIIANIFTKVLGVKNVSIHDNFFELGGHSLLATQLISRLRLAFGIDIPLRTIFASPTVAQLDQRLTQLRTSGSGLSLPQIQPIKERTQLPLSWAQERLWFLNQLEGSSATYNMPAAVRIIGSLDIEALQQALSEIVRRHEVLRTSFQQVNGIPVQVVHPEATVNIEMVDLQLLLDSERETHLQQLAQAEVLTPFDLEIAPLIRCSLLLLSATEYVVLMTMHHIVSDGWSIGVFISELSTLYSAFRTGEPSPLPPLTIQYADFAVWQRQWLRGEVLETQLNYWRSQLQDTPSLLQLPTDAPRPNFQTYQGNTQTFSLTADLTEKLQILSWESGTTLFMTLQAAFATLLYRYSGETDILIGTPIANRHFHEIESLIGFFVNTLVLRTRFGDNPSFESLLVQVRETTLQAYEHQDLPFEQVVEALQPERSLSYSPLFQVMFILQNAPMGELELPDVTLTQLSTESTIAQFDLTVTMSETEAGLVGSWEYNTDLFDSSTIERMANHFQNLLSAIVQNPQQTVGELPLLSPAEQHQLLREWNDTTTAYPTDKCIHQLFEEQVERTPDAVAVVFKNQQLTYQELNQRANQLAHHLQSLGVRPEALVGICVERSVEMVVGLLGILKAGGAYVPLDPNYPDARLSDMLNDSQASVLLTQQSLLYRLSNYHGIILSIDIQWQVISQERKDNPVSDLHIDSLAYVIYTSGSTGKPKGVMICHRSLVNIYYAWEEAYQLRSYTNSHLQMASFSFDVFTGDMVRALCSGSKLVICPTEWLLMPEQLYYLMQAEKVDCGEFVPVVIRTLINYLEQTGQNLEFLKVLIIGSDSWYVHEYQQLQRFCGQKTRLINSYGVTETTIDSCYFESTALNLPSDTLVPIGRPFSNIQIYILDRHLQPIPMGVPGEMYIGGAGLARGYLNRAALNQEKFIVNPYSDDPNARLYKTEDLVRLLSDNNLEFLGRIDNQVKIRGFRIELGEIEVVLMQNPGVREVAVIAREESGNKYIVAYIVPKEKLATPSELREFLKQKLPEYMIPSAFVFLDTLPLTPNGKIDRKALPASYSDIIRADEYVAPNTPSQEIIANIFAKVLGMQNVSVRDNFFELGGHSLLATQLVSRLRLAFGVEIPLRTIFASPTVAQLDEILTQLRTSGSGSGLILPPIQPTKERAQLPLSWAQERLWFLNQLESSSATYNMPEAVRITGSLDIEALQQALSEIVRRHEVLRTSFQQVNGIPVQVVHPEATMNIQVVDLQQLPDSERETHLQQLAQAEALTPFDLEIAPLIRCRLLLLSATEYVLLLTMHHIVSDGWSMGVFISELSTLYSAFRTGEPSPLPPLTIQYADFAVWQRQWLRGEVLENQLNYWRSQLQDTPSLLQLPTDAPRPNFQTYQGNTQTFQLNADLTQKLQILSRELGTTLFMTLQAAFATLLYRYSGEADILIGTPIANRHFHEIESLIGFFVNTLVLRTRFGDNPSFESLLVQVRETTLQAYEHQDVPFEQVVEALQPERSLSYSPLFQVMFVWQNAPMGELELPDVTLTQLSTDSTIARFDLTVTMSETEAGLVGSWEYNTDLFDSSTIERMVGHFQNLLSAIVQNPQQTVGELPLLSPAERHQLLREWNDTATAYPTDKCIHQLFEEQVERTPDAVAVVFENQQLTYQELNHRANQLAHHLQSLGVGPEVLVGICVERSFEMVVGLLGILKAGGAYVPLDPNYPSERLSHMLTDSAVEVLLTQQSLLESLPSHTAQVVCLDADWSIISQKSQQNLASNTTISNLAYIIYTSGSTGNPKGVLIPHYNLVRLFAATQSWFNFNTSDVWTFFHSYAFDFSVWEIWGALLHGGRLIVVPYLMSRSPDTFYKLLCQEKVTVLNQTPSAFAQLIQVDKSLEQVADLQLRLVIFGGEALEIQSLKPWFEKHGDQSPQLVNMYGITETTVHVTYRPLTIADLNLWGSMIGCPIPDLQVYILDQNLQPTPIGVSGEMHIGGAGLARGYLNRLELTAEKFIQNPFEEAGGRRQEAGGRLYKTGDLARYLPNGNIEYLGRIDNQVKIRGFRIELGEIEAVLNIHAQIQQAVVIAREDIPGNKRLVAYVITSNESLSSNHLREWLLSKLPEYMIPSAFVFLDKLPLTPNGKIDHKALPAPDGEIIRNNEYVAPSTPSQEIITNIFTKVLGVQNVSIHDNFFELGGHSLIATQLASRLRIAFDVEIPLRNIFASPTVAQLDQILTQLRTSRSRLSLSPIQPIKERTQLPLSWAQERLWFINQLEGSSSTYNIPLAVRITGSIDIEALQQALSAIVRRHEILRTSFQQVNGIPVQVVHPEATVNIEMVDLQQLLDSERETHLQQLAQAEALKPFDLEIAPLIRCSLLLLSATEYVVLMTMHHIVSDGWSIGVFISELSALYSAFRTEEPSPLPPLTIQYADFAVWQRQWLRGEVLENQLNYWRSQLQDTPSLLQLPTDAPRPKVQTYKGNTQTFSLHPELTEKLKTLSRESGTTLFMTLQAAFATLLYRYSGEADILIGTPIANRHFQEIESLIGFFVNTLVLRTRFGDNPSFESLLVQVRETTLQAYEHQDVPFEQVVEALQPERSLSYSPLFQVMFVWQNAPMGKLELPDVTLTQLSTDSTIAKFDLTLSMSETEVGLVGSWEYNTDLFDSSTIERMVAHFQNLLSAIVQNPQQTVGELPLLSAAERHQLLVDWNDTAKAYPNDKCIHQLFEEQVEKTPLSVAVVFEDQQLTYQELNHRANQLAHHLQSLGVGPEVLVGICAERSFEMVVGILGILKAGGAYVPLDSSYPQERLSFMLEDAQVSVLLTQQRLVHRLPQHKAQVVCLDTDWQLISQSPQENPITEIQVTNLAYVIYTSGSTGQPKGVAMNQLPLCNLIWWHLQNMPLCHGGKTLQFAPISFDVSFQEIFSTWCSGGTLLLITEELRRDTLSLLGFLEAQTVQRLFLPFVGLQQLAEVGISSQFIPHHLREIITAGEQLQVTPAIRAWFSQLTNCNLHNHYGPSESHVVSTFILTNLVDSWPILPPIGRCINNSQIYILDKHLQPVPVGVAGELYIGGVTLGRGYLNRPELTAEKFIQNPFEEAGGRLYKTGDLARYLPDGNIEYLGRIDNQVKIRGFRIELGEIEAVLNTHDQIQQAVVIAREDIPGNKRLVAYVITSNESLSSNHLREWLLSKLPEYMIPSAFVFLDKLPLTPSGKIDRKALPAADGEITRNNEYVAPSTPSAEIIANIFTKVLGVQNVSIHDNFFELGGHSLLATQLVSRLRLAFGVEIPLRTIFAAPTVAQLDQRLTQLRTSGNGLSLPPIQPIKERAELPLSWAQERLWFINQLEGSSATYNMPAAVRIIGSLDIEALQQSLSEIVRRHEVLRTSFQQVNGIPVQVVHQEARMNIQVVDLQQLLDSEQETHLQQLAQAEALTPFDLEIAPLIRCSLLLLSATEYVLLLTMHHIVSDGWSIGVFISELSALYLAFRTGEPSPLPPLAIQYADFAVWQRQWLRGEVLETQLDYWRSQLQDTPSLLQLPTDHPRPNFQTYQGNTQTFQLSVDLTQKLQILSRESGTTLFMTLQAAFATLLYRYSGEADILIGTPIANRHFHEIESLIGFFVNTLVLRTRFGDNPSFESLLVQVRETTLQAYEHQDVPFEQVVGALQPERSLSYSPLFQVMFIWQNAPMGELELPDVTLTQLSTDSTIAKFDLTLSMSETAAGLVGSWEYNTDLFDSSTIERMVAHFQNLLSAIVQNPQQTVGELPLLSPAEQRQLLVEWNDTTTEYPTDKCIHQLFEEQVEKTPNAVAVVFENQQLTYQELNHRANQLAHHLQSLGVEPEVLVGICVERSVEMVVGLLGILKAGGAYVPLDPNYPLERLSYMLTDSAVEVLLTQQSLLESLPSHTARVVCLDTDWDRISQNNQQNLDVAISVNNLVYAIYTSGSTGLPKGVAIEHHGVLALSKWAKTIFTIEQMSGVLAATSICFDLSVFEIFVTLSMGGKVIVAKNVLELTNLHTAGEVTLINTVPSVIVELLKTEGIPRQVKTVNLAGEALQKQVVENLYRYDNIENVYNLYGPSEDTTYSTVALVEKGTSEQITIGRPISNTQTYILDKYLQPVPIGVPGELCIGGNGLARSYLNRPELTAEKFIQNPFEEAGGRLYKTGDLARYLPDGNIEYLGRIDNQVKIRGFRIELGEIEAVLNTHAQIQQAVVIVREDIPGNKRLVAYMVITSDASLNNNQLRELLKQKLPEYMIPSAFVFLDTLPLTPNGKIDRKALPATDGEINREKDFIAPRSPTEKIIANIFTEVLGVENISIHDNFFTLGGHSLLATQVISRVRRVFAVNIPLKNLFEEPTIANFSKIIDNSPLLLAQQLQTTSFNQLENREEIEL